MENNKANSTEESSEKGDWRDKIKTPHVSVDIIIRHKGGIVLVKRKYPPYGWSLPGGFIDYGESAENAAIREAKEETNLDIEIVKQLKAYSDPKRDNRLHCISITFVAEGKGNLKAGDDAKEAKIVMENEIPMLCFDHNKILMDYFNDPYFELH
ncbi:NUDIX hydrolase [Candidatus Woesearchaeota archaeon]|nr:NUDIX hydrolase [Candidatus Woesearchaeota archaeon]MBT5273059.1 NUDIX hydrolase [Candidatus Woesearchaeota archaeon]MBT6040805.1 NUDIX hydrolase [Candidatus Woesearchaeota archaeon]MBT6337626.1 NUDIX hydrolase [Candidatus Woesearchaeota archaeon]MBT7926973.1 NUDIX hydrolase [Candidatus Woesearchaeota archaeon]